jgi:hypothetical protein
MMEQFLAAMVKLRTWVRITAFIEPLAPVRRRKLMAEAGSANTLSPQSLG